FSNQAKLCWISETLKIGVSPTVFMPFIPHRDCPERPACVQCRVLCEHLAPAPQRCSQSTLRFELKGSIPLARPGSELHTSLCGGDEREKGLVIDGLDQEMIE